MKRHVLVVCLGFLVSPLLCADEPAQPAQPAEARKAESVAEAKPAPEAKPAAEAEEELTSAVEIAADDDPVVCKKTKKTGSRLQKTVCQRQSKWKEAEEEAERLMHSLPHRRRVPLPNEGGGQ